MSYEMYKVKSFIHAASIDNCNYTVDREGEPELVIDMALSVLERELRDNFDLFRYAKKRSRQMYRDLWRQSDTHDKFMYLLDKAARGFFAVLAGLGGIMLVGWCITAVERMVFG